MQNVIQRHLAIYPSSPILHLSLSLLFMVRDNGSFLETARNRQRDINNYRHFSELAHGKCFQV